MDNAWYNSPKVRMALQNYYSEGYCKQEEDVPEVSALFDKFCKSDIDFEENWELISNAVLAIRKQAFRKGFYGALELLTDDD